MFIASTLNKHNFILQYNQILLYNKIFETHHLQWQNGVVINLTARSLYDAIQYQSPASGAQICYHESKPTIKIYYKQIVCFSLEI